MGSPLPAAAPTANERHLTPASEEEHWGWPEDPTTWGWPPTWGGRPQTWALNWARQTVAQVPYSLCTRALILLAAAALALAEGQGIRRVAYWRTRLRDLAEEDWSDDSRTEAEADENALWYREPPAHTP